MRKYDFSFEILDEKLAYIKNIHPLSCAIDYDSLSRLKLSIKASIKDDLFKYNDKHIRIKQQDKVVATALISTALRQKETNSMDLTCYDRCIILEQDKLEDGIIIPAYTNLVAYISDMLASYDNAFKLLDENATNKANIYFATGTPKIEVINYLLNLMNYSSLLTDRWGVFYAKKYVLPSERSVEISYSDDVQTSIIHKKISQEIDLFNVPNVFVRVTNNTSINPPIKAFYENNNPDSEVSTTVRNRRIVDYKEVSNMVDGETLFAQTKKDAYQASDVYEHLTMSTAINFEHWYLNCVALDIKTYNIADKFIETGWSVGDLKAGEKMNHKLRRVISV